MNTSEALAGSWSSALQTFLRLVRPPRRQPYDLKNPRVSRHPSGQIWRQDLCKSVFLDLTNNVGTGLRRFLRLEHVGLSGVVFYEIPTSGRDQSADAGTGTLTEGLTLTRVFGDPDDPSNLGMDTDDLLDIIEAKLVYFPGYACTSFIVSEVSNHS